MTDNIQQIRDLLKFDSEDHFYFLQILQRKKDHKGGMKVNGTNNNSRLVKAYYINSLEYFDFIMPEVIELSKIFNARAGINLNRRSYEKMALQNLRRLTEQIINKEYKKAHKAYPSVVGSYNHESDKNWILDIDGHDHNPVHLRNILYNLGPIGEKIIARIPSKNGYHLITKPFNVKDFRELTCYYDIEIHKNNPTNLYIP